MEEQQIRNFVHRISTDETLRQQLTSNPDEVIAHESFTPSVARVVVRLIPYLTLHQKGFVGEVPFGWWV